MKNYLVALKPFLIIAVLRFINTLVIPVYMNLHLRFQLQLDPKVPFLYHKASSQIISIISALVLIWVGFRICRQMKSGVLLSATAGFSFYLFIILISSIMVLLTPVMVALIPSLILWIPPTFAPIFPFNLLKSLFSQNILQDILVWSASGLVGGWVYALHKIRHKKRRLSTDVSAVAGW